MVVLSDSDLRKMLPNRVLKNFKGIFMSNQHPQKREKGLYIYNLDNSEGDASNSPNSIGTHWVGLEVGDDMAHYLDPFGKPPDDRLIKWLKKRRPNYQIWYSTSPIQDLQSSNCGFYVLDFLIDMNDGVSFYEAIHKYDIKDTKKNESTIKQKYNINENSKEFKGRGYKI